MLEQVIAKASKLSTKSMRLAHPCREKASGSLIKWGISDVAWGVGGGSKGGSVVVGASFVVGVGVGVGVGVMVT